MIINATLHSVARLTSNVIRLIHIVIRRLDRRIHSALNIDASVGHTMDSPIKSVSDDSKFEMITRWLSRHSGHAQRDPGSMVPHATLFGMMADCRAMPTMTFQVGRA